MLPTLAHLPDRIRTPDLGVIGFSVPRPPQLDPACPFARIEMPVLDGNAYEIWPAAEMPDYRAEGSIISADDAKTVLGIIALPDREGAGLAAGIYKAYEDLFALAAGRHLLRIWNYLPRINEESGGLERYRHFNLGRAKAFEKYYEGKLPPAASCLGTEGSEIIVYFLAGKTAGIPFENPRQMAAYEYPRLYGPKSPNFSRALLGDIAGWPVLFISGTASIVGHQSLHPDDPEKQTAETLINIRALLSEAEKHGFTGAPGKAKLKVYVRKPEQLRLIAAQVEKDFPLAEIVYLHADICRAELLVEIEAVIQGSST